MTDTIAFGKQQIALVKKASNSLQLDGYPTVASQIYENLWMGNAPCIGDRIERYFNALILCADEYQPHHKLFGNNIQVINAPLFDDYSYMSKSDMITAVRAGGCVARLLREGKTVLVTCIAGRNRSGLVCVIALCAGPSKMVPEEAIAIVRQARGPEALQNPQFLAFIKSYIGRMNTTSLENELNM